MYHQHNQAKNIPHSLETLVPKSTVSTADIYLIELQ